MAITGSGGDVTVWDFKKCPRCKGDIYIDEDAGVCYEKCLQCGYERELARVTVATKKAGGNVDRGY